MSLRIKRLAVSALTAIAVPLTLTAVPTSAVAQSRPCDRVPVFAHQGSAKDGDANTIRAYRGAIRKRKADGVEGDVQRTRDGKFVMFHDADVSRGTTGSGLISDKTLSEVRKLRTLRSRDRIPTLGQALKAMRATKTPMFIELKSSATWPADALPKLVKKVKSKRMKKFVVLYGDDPSTIRTLHTRWPAIRTSLRVTTLPADLSWLTTRTDGVSLPLSLATRSSVARLKDAGLSVHSTDLNKRRQWARAIKAGMDTVLSDRTAAYAKRCAG